MKRVKIIVLILFFIMLGMIINGFIAGDFSTEGKQLLAMAWGMTTLTDLIIGFALFAGWIWYRESSSMHAAIWTLALFSLGFLTGCAYVLLALHRADGDWHQFWLGSNR